MSNLWWLYTIVLGGAFALVARSIAEELKIRRMFPESRLFVTAIIWQIFLLLLIVQVWAGFSFYQRTVTEISVFSMFAFLCVPIGIYIMVVVLFNNYPWSSDWLSEEEVFARNRPLFFGALIATPIINIIHEAVLGNSGFDRDLLFQLILVAGGVVGLFIRKPKFDQVLGIAMIIALLAYIALDYSTLTLKT